MKRVVVFRAERRLTDDQMAEAFAGNSGTLWYRALVQLIGDETENAIMAVAAASEQGNAMRIATESGGYAALNGLLGELARRTQASS